MGPTLFFLFAGLLALILGVVFRHTSLIPAVAGVIGLSESRSGSTAAAAYGFAFAVAVVNGLGLIISFWDWQLALWLVVITINVLAVVFGFKLVKGFIS